MGEICILNLRVPHFILLPDCHYLQVLLDPASTPETLQDEYRMETPKHDRNFKIDS
jgi:hypothetical protein